MRKLSLILVSAIGLASLAAWVWLRPHGGAVASAAWSVPVTTSAPVVGEPAPPLNPQVVEFIASANAGHVRDALQMIDSISSRLSERDVDALLRWTTGPRPAKIGEDTWYAVVNDVWNAVIRQEEPPQALIPTLVTFFRDRATPYVLRDYAIQHLGNHMEQHYASIDAAQRRLALEALKKAIAMHSQGFAGTALYSVERIKSEAATDFPKLEAEHADAVLALLADPAAAKLARISALQIAMENRDPRAATHARKIAADPNCDPMLRAPAIAYLGRFGSPEDFALLQAIAERCTDRRLLGALQPALTNLANGTPIAPR